jgi:hypothetical protein
LRSRGQAATGSKVKRRDASVVSRFLPTHCTILPLANTEFGLDINYAQEVETKGFKQVSSALHGPADVSLAGSGKLSTGCDYRRALHKLKLCSIAPRFP